MKHPYGQRERGGAPWGGGVPVCIGDPSGWAFMVIRRWREPFCTTELFALGTEGEGWKHLIKVRKEEDVEAYVNKATRGRQFVPL